MSEKNPYNPEGLSDEEIEKIDEEQTKKRQALLAERRAAMAETPGVGKIVLENTLANPKWKLPGKKFNKGIAVRNAASGLLRTREEISDRPEAKETKIENPVRKLFKEIKRLLKKYEFGGGFRITRSKENRDNYIFQLLAESKKRFTYELEWGFEDKPENIVERVKKYMDNSTYAHKV